VALGNITQLQAGTRGNIQGSSSGSLSLVKLQLSPSPSESNDKVETPKSYDRKALSELLRSSALTLVQTDNQLKEAREHIEALKLSLIAKDKELTISKRSLASLTTSETQTEEADTTLTHTVETQTEEADISLTHTVESQIQTDEESQLQDCKQVIISDSNFASSAEFESIVCELVATRLELLNLSSALEATQSELMYHRSKVASLDARPR